MTDHAHLWNHDLERAVLGVVLDGRHKDAWGTLAQALPHAAFFFHRDHQLIYLAMQALAERGVAIDAMAVCSECQATVWRDAVERLRWVRQLEDSGQAPTRALVALPPPPDGLTYDDSLLAALGGFNAITSMAEVLAPAASLERNCALVADYYRTRRLVRAVDAARSTLLSPKGVKEFAAVGSALINAASRELGQATGDQTMAQAVDEALTLHDDAAGAGAARASWGLPTLDAMAPLTADTFAVLAAPPKCGKTSLLLQAVEATAELGGPDSVCVISREMGSAELARVLVARRTGIPATSLRDGTLTRDERNQVAAEVERWRTAGSVVIQADADRVSVDDVCAWARMRHLRAAGRLRLIVIDYLQLLDGTNPKDTEYQRVSHATRRLKLLQRSLRVPVLLLSQLSRDGTRAARSAAGDLGLPPEPQLSDLRGSGSIEQDANVVAFLWPRQTPGAPTQAVTVKLAANRAGPTGLIDCTFHRTRGQIFTEIQADTANDRGKRLEAVPSAGEDLFG